MKTFINPFLVILSLLVTLPQSHGRDFGRGSGGRSGGAKRNPMTGSKIQRPSQSSRSVSRPASRPSSKPAVKRPSTPSRPSVSRPSTSRPSTSKPTIKRPEASKPSIKRPEVSKPSTSRPSIDKKPDINRPSIDRPNLDKKPDLARPSIGDRSKPGLPDKRPQLNRPDKSRPSTLPGMVSYPDRAGKPGSIADRRDRPDIGGVKGGDRLKIGEVNVGGRNKGLTRPGNVIGDRNIGDRSWSNDKRWSDNKIWGNGNNIGNDININIDNSFRNNNNFSYRPGYWGARPWWGAGSYHGWHHGHCHCGWSAGYYHRHWYYHDNDDFAKGFMWGIGVWSLGNLIYNMGYNQYSNPYQAPPVQNTYITYEQPVSVAAAANPPAEVQVATEASEPAEIADTELGEEKSAEALDKSRAAFRSGDYPGALKSVDVALAYTPSDVSLHEFRALIYFALGKYAEAAGILNPVLASGPGWSWETMAGFYTKTSTYEEQFRKLEEFSKSTPDRADVHFLLGYHYMVTGHMEESNAQFAKAAELQPADTIATQLRDLTADSIPVETPTDNPEPRPEPVDLKELQGTWISETDGGTITFTLKESGDYSWVFGESKLEGTYGLDDQGLLVLTTDDSQMVSVIEMKGETGFHFTLVGSPSGDPGLDFKKS